MSNPQLITARRADIAPTALHSVSAGLERVEVRLHLNAMSHPYLVDHNIAGTPVVPVAIVLDWFTAVVRAWLPEPAPAVIRRLSVLRKIGLDRYANSGHPLTVRGIRDDAQLHLALLGDGDSKHYLATASIAASPTPAEWTVPIDLKPAPPDVYDGRMLFHGPMFQVIREVQGVSASGAAAVLSGAAGMGWNPAAWHIDPAAIDGGLQVAVLWAKQVLGCATLPMGVTECRTYQPGPYDGPTLCIVRARDVWRGGAECDIAFLGEDGTVRAELFRVSLVPRPGG